MGAGIGIMCVGVGFTQVVLVFDFHIIHALGDVVGYGIHGIGGIPFVEYVISKFKDEKKPDEKDLEEAEEVEN